MLPGHVKNATFTICFNFLANKRDKYFVIPLSTVILDNCQWGRKKVELIWILREIGKKKVKKHKALRKRVTQGGGQNKTIYLKDKRNWDVVPREGRQLIRSGGQTSVGSSRERNLTSKSVLCGKRRNRAKCVLEAKQQKSDQTLVLKISIECRILYKEFREEGRINYCKTYN